MPVATGLGVSFQGVLGPMEVALKSAWIELDTIPATGRGNRSGSATAGVQNRVMRFLSRILVPGFSSAGVVLIFSFRCFG